ncbi:Ig-like domain-containing protein [Aeromonas caviae]|uniref:Ig-like domain-containing protein n=1 Tax=Aeromonas caviae TaxID=648 RepID=UPI00388F64CF
MIVNIVDDKLTVGETSEVTFTFSEKVTGFELGATWADRDRADHRRWRQDLDGVTDLRQDH